MIKYYLDTCIWRDYFENREDKYRPLGEWAFTLIQKIIENNDIILISEVILKELHKQYSEKQVESLLDVVPNKILSIITLTEGHVNKAARIMKKSNIPFSDALHAAIALENNAILVTRDRHFSIIEEHLTVRKPEELI